MADDLRAPRTGWFWLTVLRTISETCRVCDAVMDTLKKITPSRFSTLPTLCWTEKGILTSPQIISMLSCFSILFPAYNFCYWQSSERTLSITTKKWPRHCLSTFLSNISRKIPWFKHFGAALYRASPTFDYILLLAGPAGWCCDWCHGPSARGPGLNSPWQPKSTLLRCPSARYGIPTSCRDAALKRCSTDCLEKNSAPFIHLSDTAPLR